MIESDAILDSTSKVVEAVYQPLPDRVRHDCLIPGEVCSSQAKNSIDGAERHCHQSLERTFRDPTAFADVDRGLGDGQVQDLYSSYGCESLFLLSAKSIAARHERKHEWVITTILFRRTDLSGYTQEDLDKVALRLNSASKKTLGFQTPASRLQESVVSTSWSWRRLSDISNNVGPVKHF